MSNIANSIMLQKPDKSVHNMTEELRTTTSLGRITPVYMQEVVPGDEIDINCEFLTKFQPLETPAFQNFNAYVHFFYVPFRILWKNWKFYIQNQPVPGFPAPPSPPYLDLSGLPMSRFTAPNLQYIHNYFGFTSPTNLEYVNALPYAAYQLIYNEYYRHEQMEADNSENLQMQDGDQLSIFALLEKTRYRTYKDDYFTMALKAPQSGNEATLALTTSNMLPVQMNQPIGMTDTDAKFNATGLPSATGIEQYNIINPTTDPDIPSAYLYVDPSQASYQISMNELIELNRMQEFLVRQNLAGNRYNEYILAFFGVQVPDLRIDRPDYITGLKAPVQISEVLNTATDQGYQTGQGNSYSEGGRKNYTVLEHGIIMGLYTCIPTLGYMNAINRFMFKRSYEDYFVPIFDQMGEREILNKEIVQDHIDPFGTFGYVPKFAEYRMTFNKVTGEFGTNLTTWHLAQDNPNNLTLNSQFFDIKNPDRVFQVSASSADSILLWIVNKVFINRPIKKYSMPVLSNNYGNNLT